jgi:hypothetical protein
MALPFRYFRRPIDNSHDPAEARRRARDFTLHCKNGELHQRFVSEIRVNLYCD